MYILKTQAPFQLSLNLIIGLHLLCFYRKQIVDQETLEEVEEIKAPVVFCVAAWFGKARLLDNIEINI